MQFFSKLLRRPLGYVKNKTYLIRYLFKFSIFCINIWFDLNFGLLLCKIFFFFHF